MKGSRNGASVAKVIIVSSRKKLHSIKPNIDTTAGVINTGLIFLFNPFFPSRLSRNCSRRTTNSNKSYINKTSINCSNKIIPLGLCLENHGLPDVQASWKFHSLFGPANTGFQIWAAILWAWAQYTWNVDQWKLGLSIPNAQSWRQQQPKPGNQIFMTLVL